MTTLVRDGLELRYEVSGGSGPALLLPHLQFSWPDYLDLGPLVERFTVVIASPRGFAGSSRLDADAAYRVADLTDDLIAVMQAIGFERFSVFGYSFTGAFAPVDRPPDRQGRRGRSVAGRVFTTDDFRGANLELPPGRRKMTMPRVSCGSRTVPGSGRCDGRRLSSSLGRARSPMRGEPDTQRRRGASTGDRAHDRTETSSIGSRPDSEEDDVPVKEASFADTPFGCYITSDGWFILNLGDALAVRNEEKGGASYPIESQEYPFEMLGVHLRVLWPGDPNALYHCEGAQEGFLVLSGECTLVVEEDERPLRQWDYFHCPAGTRHVLVGAGEGPCSILMIGTRPDEPLHYPVSEIAARYGASAATETSVPDRAYADWPGDYEPTRLPWPIR